MVADPQATTLRIVVVGEVVAGEARGGEAVPPRQVLERIGDGACIEARSCREDVTKNLVPAELDLLVVDGLSLDGAELRSSIERLAFLGPPVLAVLPERDDGLALQAFRSGADQCVCRGPDFELVLLESALELIHDWQAEREQVAVARHVEWLEGLNDAVVNRMPAALVVVGHDDRIVSANPEASRLLCRRGSQAIGRNFADVVPEALYRDAALGDLVAAARRGEPPRTRRARVHEAGRLVSAHDVQAQSLDASGRVLLVLSNVTASERQAERIDELQRYNAELVQGMSSALLVVGTEGRVQFVNPMAEQLFDVGSGELLGRRLPDAFAPDDPGAAALRDALETGARLRGLESRVQLGEGRTVPVALSASSLSDAPGRHRGAVVVLHDLSEIKQLERQVAQSEKLASIGQLAAGVAHEINNPVGFVHANLFQSKEYLDDLDAVFAAVEALQHRVEEGADRDCVEAAATELRHLAEKIDLAYVRGDLRKALEESQEGTERIRHIVRDLRGFSRSDDERVARADINECIESTANIVWTMNRHVVSLERDYADLPRLRCRPMQIKQVVLNLLVNACQAIAERGEGASAPGVVRVTTRAVEGGVSIEIQDNGVGMSRDVQARVFDPFFTTKEVGAGTGLGLSTVYGIIERHGGEIRAASQPGAGSTFSIFLPDAVDPRALDGEKVAIVDEAPSATGPTSESG